MNPTMLIVAIVFFLFLNVIAAALYFGRLSSLVSGYNYKAKGEKAKKYERYMLKRMAYFLSGFSAGLFAAFMSAAFSAKILMYVFLGLTAVYFIAGVIYLTSSKKLRRAQFLAHKLSENPHYRDEQSETEDFLG